MDAVTTSVSFRGGDASRSQHAARREGAERPPRAERDDDHDRGCHRGRGCGEDGTSSMLKVSLKAEIQSTFAALAGGDDADSAAAAPAAEFDAELKARIRFDGPEGRIDFKMKLQLDDVDRDTFDAALHSFTETLYAALRTMFGSEPQAPAAVPGDSAAVTQAALAADPAAAPAAAPATPPATDVQVADADVVASPAPQPVATVAADPAAPAPAPQPAGGQGAIDLRIRLSYTSFGDHLGSMLQRLAQPADSANAHPLADDLAASFDRLTAAAGGDTPQRLSLGNFLAALAQRFAAPPAPATAADEPAAASDAPAAEEAPAPAAPTSSYSVLRFTAEYRQVFAYTTPAPQPLALAA